MRLSEIYNQLLTGSKLTIEFGSRAEFLTFRSSLYRFKAIQDTILSDIGELDNATSIKIVGNWNEIVAYPQSISFQFTAKSNHKEYKIVVVENVESSESGETTSAA